MPKNNAVASVVSTSLVLLWLIALPWWGLSVFFPIYWIGWLPIVATTAIIFGLGMIVGIIVYAGQSIPDAPEPVKDEWK